MPTPAALISPIRLRVILPSGVCVFFIQFIVTEHLYLYLVARSKDKLRYNHVPFPAPAPACSPPVLPPGASWSTTAAAPSSFCVEFLVVAQDINNKSVKQTTDRRFIRSLPIKCVKKDAAGCTQQATRPCRFLKESARTRNKSYVLYYKVTISITTKF